MPLFADVPCEQDDFVSIEGYTRAQWKKTIALAVGIHLFVLILMLLPASLFEFRHKREEIYTVNLFEAREAAPARKEAPPPAAVQKKEVVQPPPPPVVKKVEVPPPVKQPEIVEKIVPVPPAEPVVSTSSEVVSLKPRLVKKEVKPKTVEKKVDKNEEIKVDQAVNRIKNELARKQAEQKAKQMQAEASAAVDDAVAQAEEIAQGYEHAGEGRSVIGDLQQALSIMAELRHPDVRDLGRAMDLGQNNTGLRRYNPYV